jgi:hypothetical protein
MMRTADGFSVLLTSSLSPLASFPLAVDDAIASATHSPPVLRPRTRR